MKLILLKLLVFAILIPLVSNGQEIGEFKFVTSINDLTLRNVPNGKGAKIGICKPGSKVIIQDVDRMDTIDMRIANWLEVSNEESILGYVFGGYLNSNEMPTTEEIEAFWSITEILNYLTEKYKPELISSYNKLMIGDKEQLNLNIWNNDKICINMRSGYEWEETDYILKEWKLYEVINLIELCNWFGKNYEYDHLKSSLGPDKLTFKYKTAHSDPERNVYIEQGHNAVRITINSSL